MRELLVYGKRTHNGKCRADQKGWYVDHDGGVRRICNLLAGL